MNERQKMVKLMWDSFQAMLDSGKHDESCELAKHLRRTSALSDNNPIRLAVPPCDCGRGVIEKLLHKNDSAPAPAGVETWALEYSPHKPSCAVFKHIKRNRHLPARHPKRLAVPPCNCGCQ